MIEIAFVVLCFGFALSEENCTVSSNDDVLYCFCHHNYTGNAHIIFNTSVFTKYNISGNGTFCLINVSGSIVIETQPANNVVIECINNNTVSHFTNGLAFAGSASLTISNVKFIKCGANLTTLGEELLDTVNSSISHMYFTQHHATSLLIVGIKNVTMYSVNISNYYGFATIAINLAYTNFSLLNVNLAKRIILEGYQNFTVGCGILLLYNNKMNKFVDKNFYVLIQRSVFSYNWHYINNLPSISNIFQYFKSCQVNCVSITNAPGLSIIFSQMNTTVKVDIINTDFFYNEGSLAGALLILHLNTSTLSQITVSYSNFDDNSSYKTCQGNDIIFAVYFEELWTSDTMFMQNLQRKDFQVLYSNFTNKAIQQQVTTDESGAIYICLMNANNLPIKIFFSNLNFGNNQAPIAAACIFAESLPPQVSNNIEIVLESIVAINNSKPALKSLTSYSLVSVFYFTHIHDITINGTQARPGKFTDNHGSVIEAIHSNITLEGHLVFNNNTGINGAAILLAGDSYIYFSEGLRANFTQNRAISVGGAIHTFTTTSYCTFRFKKMSSFNISLYFSNNSAGIYADSVYSSRLYNCYMYDKLKPEPVYNLVSIYNRIFKPVPNDHQVLFTDAAQITHCRNKAKAEITYPGKTILVSLNALDATGRMAYATVSVIAFSSIAKINWQFQEHERIQVIKNCTDVSVTILTSSLDHNITGKLMFSSRNAIVYMWDVYLHPCPPGFQLNNYGQCVCSTVLKQLYNAKCNISAQTISRPYFTSWASANSKNKTFLTSSHCPYGYCNYEFHLDLFLINKQKHVTLTSTKNTFLNFPICLHNRTGVLCSQCQHSLSITFGSTICKDCSNWWLLTLLVYAIIGPLFIYLLYILNLTITTGTINGILFYTQVSNAGLLDILMTESYFCKGSSNFGRKAAMIFISLLNLNIGFPLCFFNGMTEIWKAGLSLLFPIYLLIIVVALIIASHFSIRLSNKIADTSVQVLVTVVHISFSKLLLAIIDVFIPSYIYSVDNSTIVVWFNDGSIAYGEYPHKVLMIITALTVGVTLLPYMVVIMFGRCLMKFTKVRLYLRPIHEAIHAPFKYNKQYWFTARQLLLCFEYAMYTMFRGKSIAAILMTVPLVHGIFVIVQAWLQPYKNKLINALDLFLMTNVVVLVTTNWYFIEKKVVCDIEIVDTLLVGTVFLIFCCVITYHIVLVTGQMGRLSYWVNDIRTRIPKFFARKDRHQAEMCSSFFDDRYSNYREPLISP